MDATKIVTPAPLGTANDANAVQQSLARPSVSVRLSSMPRERQAPWYRLSQVATEELKPASGASESHEGLTSRELLALACAANGLTARQAGRSTYKSADTIKTQLGAARLKLGARNTTHAVAIALQRHLLVETAEPGQRAA